jgi:hypothetical protein
LVRKRSWVQVPSAAPIDGATQGFRNAKFGLEACQHFFADGEVGIGNNDRSPSKASG